MKMAIKTYNLYHNIWDKLIFGFLIPAFTILMFILVAMTAPEVAFIVFVVYTMGAEIVRDFFSFNGTYSRHAHHTILRSSYHGKKIFLGAVMSEHIRNLAHYAIMLGICLCITTAFNGFNAYRVLVGVMIVMVAFIMNTLAVNVVRYFDNFTIYPFAASPFVAIAVIFTYIFAGSGRMMSMGVTIIIMVCISAVSVLVTVLSYIHASRCYDKSFEDKIQ